MRKSHCGSVSNRKTVSLFPLIFYFFVSFEISMYMFKVFLFSLESDVLATPAFSQAGSWSCSTHTHTLVTMTSKEHSNSIGSVLTTTPKQISAPQVFALTLLFLNNRETEMSYLLHLTLFYTLKVKGRLAMVTNNSLDELENQEKHRK